MMFQPASTPKAFAIDERFGGKGMVSD
jgi:hypothetical protein